MRFVAVALLLLVRAAHATPLQLEEVPETPSSWKPHGRGSDRRAAILRGDLPDELVPRRYLRSGLIPRGGRYYDASGEVYRFREVALAVGQCEPSTASLAESDRHLAVAVGWSAAGGALAWTGLGALCYIPSYHHGAKARQHWADALATYNGEGCGGQP